jgi:hypothetical protein
MQYTFRRNNFLQWSKLHLLKIESSINNCTTLEQLNESKTLIDYFIIITSLEDNVEDNDLESIASLFWFKINLKKIIILKQNN